MKRRKKGKVQIGAAVLAALCAALALILVLRLHSDIQPPPAPTVSVTPSPAVTAAITDPTPTARPTPEAAESPASTPFRPPAGYTEQSYRLVSDMVYTYAALEHEGAEIIRADLDELNALDPALGALWEKLMACWAWVNTELPISYGCLPDGLPEDDSLCIVVLGFQLNADGTMSPELVARCETALASAEKYPEAVIAVTGGGTAWQDHSATEAGRMADWLTARGVAPERILIEDKSLTTADNAVFTCTLLRERFPQVTKLAIVSSDYHLPLGVLLFQEKALLYEYETGTLPFTVAANAAYNTYGLVSPDTPMQQRSYLWSVANPTY